MIRTNHLIIAALLAVTLPTFVFPKLIYVMCEIILGLTCIVNYSERKKDNLENSLLARLFYLCVFIIAWGIMLLIFVSMQILTYIEVFGGFVNEEILNLEE